MSEKINVDHAFDPEARQAQKDLDSYLDSRPYKDENGNTRDAENNLVDSNYFDTQREQHEAETMPTAYEDMTMPDLARALASAEHEADKTKSEDIQDALLDKMAEFTEKNNLDNDAQENLWNRIMKVKDGESEKLSKKHEKVSDESKSGAVDKDTERQQQIRDEIIAIKKGMAERAKNGLDSPDYDAAYEDAQDDRVIDLLKEAYGTNEAEDPRIVKAVRELNDYEDRLVNNDPDVKAGKILRNISESRLKNAEWSDADEEARFLEFLDILKQKFGTDNLDDPRIQDALSRATEKINLDHEWLVASEKSDDSSDSGASLREDLAKIPDLEESENNPTKIMDSVEPVDFSHLPPNPFERINQSKEYEGNSNLAMKAKIDTAKRMVTQGLSPEDALRSLVLASMSDFDNIAIQKFNDEGIDSPTEEQLKIHKEQLINSLYKSLSAETTKSPAGKSSPKETSLSRGVDKGVDKLSKYVDRKTRKYVYKIEDFKNNPEKQKKRKMILAGLGSAALSAATFLRFS